NDDQLSAEGSMPVQFATIPSGDSHQGTGNGSPALGTGGYPGLPFLGASNGGGPGVGGGPRIGSVVSISDPGDGAPTPTPEPATMVLIGSNVALLGAAVLRRRRRRRETDLSG